MANAPKTNHLTLTVRSTTAEFVDEFNAQNKAEKVLEVAIKRFNLNPSPPRPYVLVRKTAPEKLLALQDKLGEKGVADGDVIFVQASEAEDG